jgi:predicted acyltransferase (DUF342 family)
MLASVGGYLSIYSNVILNANFLNNINYKSVDNYLFVIKKTSVKKGITIHEGYNAKGVVNGVLNEQPTIYVAEQGNYSAHGNTIKKAIEDLNFKILSDKIQNEPIQKDTIITKEKYRMITGACEFGCQQFMAANNLAQDIEIKAIDLMLILEKTKPFGYSKIKQLINF